MKEQANDVFEICSYVDGLEKKIDSMTEELTNMQNQIKEMQEDTLVNNAKKALSEAQERLNTRCEQIKSQVLEVKEQVKSTAKGIVEEAKEKGRAALYRVSEFLGIKKRLLDIRENVRDAIKTTDKDIAKTAFLAKGLREAGQTAANAFRTFADKSEVDYSQKEQKHPITKAVLAKMFYNHLGLYGEDLKVAKLEQFIAKQGKTDEFRRVFEQKNGSPWVESRDAYAFFEDDVVDTLTAVLGMSETAARNWFNGTETAEISIAQLVSEIKDYVDSKPDNFRLLFMVDEVGQYIGTSTDLLLNLQSLVEELGAKCNGKVWVCCTGQEAINEIIKVRNDEFSRIQARFKTRLKVILREGINKSLGWRGYGEDAVGAYNSWFKESIIFGCIWSLWHLPLFWIPGTYQYGLKEMGIMYVINFLLSVIPLDFLQTWVYVKNNRSMLATIIFHLFINIMQEKINMTPETKCIQTIFVVIAAIIIVVINKEMFFETQHVGSLLEEKIMNREIN